MPDKQPVVAVLGLGNMGAALANCILSNGHELVVWNRTSSKAETLVEKGAKLAQTVREAIELSDTIIVNVLNYAVSDSLLRVEAVEEILPGKTIVQLTTGTPKDGHEAAEWAKSCGADYLDGAIMAIADTVGDPEALFFYSGERRVFDRNESLFRQLGGNTVYSGESYGGAAAFDLGLLSYIMGAGAFFTHGLALSISEGVSIDDFQKMAVHLTKNLMPVAFQYQASMIEKNSYTETPSSTAAISSAWETIARFSEENKVDPTLPRMILDYSKKVIDAGYGEQDFAVLIDILRKS